jgi:hypothetical protein
MKLPTLAIPLIITQILSGASVLSLDITTMQTDTSDATLPAYNGSFGKVISLNTEVPVLTADASYSGPDVYGGVSRNIFKGAGGVSNNGGSGWRIRVNKTTPFSEETANSGALAISVLHAFNPIVDGSPGVVQFSEGADVLDASNIFISDMASVVSASICFVVRSGGLWYVSEASANIQSGGLEGNLVSSYSINALSSLWYTYDPLTDVSTAVSKGAAVTPEFSSVDFVGFLLESESIEDQGGYNYGVRTFDVEGIGTDVPATWAGYPILQDGWIDTTSWLGWMNVSEGDYVWSLALNKYIYLPESFVDTSGAWSYVPVP